MNDGVDADCLDGLDLQRTQHNSLDSLRSRMLISDQGTNADAEEASNKVDTSR